MSFQSSPAPKCGCNISIEVVRISHHLNLSNPPRSAVAILEECNILESFPNSYKVSAQFQDADFKPPFYNVWAFARTYQTRPEVRLQ
jgi:hypothetical protein